jgi:inosine/xanthosine triphosphatase
VNVIHIRIVTSKHLASLHPLMRVVVGSTNPVKVDATERIVGELFDATVEGTSVDSGVSEQPTGTKETVTGARTRARRALESDPDADFGVGIEGGVAQFDATEGLFLVMWAAVTDDERMEVGDGPALRLPDSIADRIQSGEELGPVLDDVLDTSDINEREGAAGVLTGHAIDRQSALEHAVAGAFGPFVTEYY